MEYYVYGILVALLCFVYMIFLPAELKSNKLNNAPAYEGEIIKKAVKKHWYDRSVRYYVEFVCSVDVDGQNYEVRKRQFIPRHVWQDIELGDVVEIGRENRILY